MKKLFVCMCMCACLISISDRAGAGPKGKFGDFVKSVKNVRLVQEKLNEDVKPLPLELIQALDKISKAEEEAIENWRTTTTKKGLFEAANTIFTFIDKEKNEDIKYKTLLSTLLKVKYKQEGSVGMWWGFKGGNVKILVSNADIVYSEPFYYF